MKYITNAISISSREINAKVIKFFNDDFYKTLLNLSEKEEQKLIDEVVNGVKPTKRTPKKVRDPEVVASKKRGFG